MKLTPQHWAWDGAESGSVWPANHPADSPLVWQAWLPDDPATQSHLASLLSADEHARLARLQSRDDQLRFLAGRGLPDGYLGATGCLHLADFLTTPDKECS